MFILILNITTWKVMSVVIKKVLTTIWDFTKIIFTTQILSLELI
jgi:hypothetical protein